MAILKFFIRKKHALTKAIRELYRSIMDEKKVTYSVEEINTATHKVTIRCRGTRAIIITTFAEVISDHKLIAGLSPEQSCLIGGYYGRMIRNSCKKTDSLNKVKKMSFLLKNGVGKYSIIFQNRDGSLGYIDNKTQKDFLEYPLTIVDNKHIINNFDPSQACYIGLLAGISIEKSNENQLANILKKPPTLRIIN